MDYIWKMKLLLFFLFCSSFAFTGKNYLLEITVLDPMKVEPLKGLFVKIDDSKGKSVEGYTDSLGKVDFILDYKVLNIHIEDINNLYADRYQSKDFVLMNKKRSNQTHVIELALSASHFLAYCEQITDSFFENKDTTVIADSTCATHLQFEASFPGGPSNLQRYISDQIEYPTEAKELGDQGRVYVSFVVERNGSITNVQIIRGVSPALDRETKRLVRAMPRWIPAYCESGGFYRTRVMFPVNFVIQ